MKNLIYHTMMENLKMVLKKSCLNCHAVGVQSIVVSDAPGQMIRIFFAEEHHDLWKNCPSSYRDGMSVGFHGHHCNLTLHCLIGEVWNWVASDHNVPITTKHLYIEHLSVYRYFSKLRGEQPGFKKLGSDWPALKQLHFERIAPGLSSWMNAVTFHTVFVPRYQTAAWAVYEGREDSGYLPITYSTSDLTKADFSQLYQPMTTDELHRILSKFKLLS